MTVALITVDTEFSALLHRRGADATRNHALSIDGQTSQGAYGIGWQMDVLDRCGLKGVYFVDPMPALVHGQEVIEKIVEPILRRGHEVQLHIHTEWLEWAKQPLVAGRGQNIGDFDYADQLALLSWARDRLVEAGAPSPVAFRAGNYGANDDTLKALAALGLQWDTSYNCLYAPKPCALTLEPGAIDPVDLDLIGELPVAAIFDVPGRARPVQICALSASEMRGAVKHAAETGRPAFVIVTHSFEMLSRDRMRPNRSVISRFEAMCEAIATTSGMRSGGFEGLSLPAATTPGSRLPPNRWRTLRRMGEQAVATWLYERQLRPV